MFPSYLEFGKNWFLAILSLTNTVAAIWREKKWIPAILKPKMQFITVKSKEKDYDISLKSEKLVHSQQEHEKYVSQLFGIGKNWFLAISSLTNTVAAIWREKKVNPCYLETKKCSSQLLGARKKIMTSIQSQKNWFTASRSTKKMFSRYLEEEETSYQLFRAKQTLLQLFGERKKWIPAIWRPKNIIHNCQEQGKRL